VAIDVNSSFRFATAVFIFFNYATARGTLSTQSRVDHRCSATYTRSNRNSSVDTIFSARSAFHAGVAICYHDLPVFPGQHTLRTYFDTNTAPGTIFRIVLQRYHIIEISKPEHEFSVLHCTKGIINHAIDPIAKAPAIAGAANLISFFTPEREVKVEHPVKFMAK
jgi:hypothetical protein